MFFARVVSSSDNLKRIVDEINQSSWDDENEMTTYDVESLSAYLARQDTLFVTCHELDSDSSTLVGIASSRLEMKPYGRECWLYVDEVDVCADQRQKGAGRFIMSRLIEIAKERGCVQVWLGAEAGNSAANALYRSLGPEDVAQVVGYSYEFDE